MGNKLNPFEEQLQKAANQFEVPYDITAWTKLEKNLNKISSDRSSISHWGYAAVVIFVVGQGLFAWFSNSPTNNKVQTSTSKNTIDIVEKPFTKNQISEVETLHETESNKTTIDKKEIKTYQSDNTKIAVNATPFPSRSGTEIAQKNKVAENNEIINDLEQKPFKSISGSHSLRQEPIKQTTVKSQMNIYVEKTTVCAGTEVIFTLKGIKATDVIWKIGRKNLVSYKDDKGTLVFVFNEEGQYSVKALSMDLENESNELEITVLPKPNASFVLEKSLAHDMIPTVRFEANAKGEKNYHWSFGDGLTASGEEVSHTYTKAKEYEVSLRVTNKNGCSWINYQHYTQSTDFNLFAPNSFSPNNDGTNDQWFPNALASGYYQFELNVYNRANKLVFSTSDPQDSWNGMINGTLANSGDFFMWEATVVDPNGIQQQFAGTILAIY